MGSYSLNIYSYEYDKLLESSNAYEILDGVAVLQNLSLYHEDIGLYYENGNGGMFI